MEMAELDKRWQDLESASRPSSAQLRQYLKTVRSQCEVDAAGAVCVTSTISDQRIDMHQLSAVNAVHA